MERVCKYCGAIVINQICQVCHRDAVVTPPSLMSAALFNINPYLKARLEWQEQIRHNSGIPNLPVDPTRLNLENLPSKKLPNHNELPRKKKQKPDIDQVEF